MANNEDKIFNLLEKVYVELQETKKEVKDNTTRLTKIEITLENNITPSLKNLYDTQTQILTKLEDTIKDSIAYFNIRFYNKPCIYRLILYV